ncbi:MAG: hypothetical protein ACOZAR_03200 [Patescibacteria group bacterium]
MKLENNQNLVFEPTNKSIIGKNNQQTYFEKLKKFVQEGTKGIKDFSQEAAKLPNYLIKQKAKEQKRREAKAKAKPAIPVAQNDCKKISKLPQKICTIAGLSGILLLNYIRPSEIEGKSIDKISLSNVRVSVHQRHEYHKSDLENIALRDDSIDLAEVVVKVRLNSSEANQHRRKPSIKENVDYKSLILNPKSAEEVWKKIKNLKNNNGEQPKIYLNKKISSYCDGVICKDGNPPTPYFSYAVDKTMLGQ